jgi:hypothetical protein
MVEASHNLVCVKWWRDPNFLNDTRKGNVGFTLIRGNL